MRRFFQLNKSQHGQSMVEFALALLVFSLIVLGIIDFGRAFYDYNTLSNAAREGARVGVIPTKSYTDVRQIVKEKGVALNLTDADIAITGRYPGMRFTVTVTYQFRAVTPLINAFFPDGSLTLVSSASMREEY